MLRIRQALAGFHRSARVEQVALLLALTGACRSPRRALAHSPPLLMGWTVLCAAIDCLLPLRPFADGTRRAMANDILWAGGVMATLAWRLYVLPKAITINVAEEMSRTLVILAIPAAALLGISIAAAITAASDALRLSSRAQISDTSSTQSSKLSTTADSSKSPQRSRHLYSVLAHGAILQSHRVSLILALFVARLLVSPLPASSTAISTTTVVDAAVSAATLAMTVTSRSWTSTLFTWLSPSITPLLAMVIAPSLVLTFPMSFSLAEACIISCLFTTIVHFGSILLWTPTSFSISDSSSSILLPINQTLLFVYALVLGIALIVLLSAPLLVELKYLAKGKQKENAYPTRRINFAIRFYALTITIVLGVITPVVWWKLGQNPWVWILQVIVGSRRTLHLFGLWSMLLGGAFFFFPWGASLNIQRKFYHLLATLIMTPGFVLAPDFLTIATAFIFSIFIFLEMVRYARIPPFGDFLHEQLTMFSDDRDEGDIITSHMYLLLGMALPVWVVVAERGSTAQAMVAGVSGMMTLGLGDTLASILGKALRSPHWPDSRKTFIGTCGFALGCGIYLSSVVTTLTFCAHHSWLPDSTSNRFITELGLSLKAPFIVSTEKVWHILSTVLLTALVESTTTQFDNLFIPIYTMLLLL